MTNIYQVCRLPIVDLSNLLDDGLVACPVCNRRMKNEAVFQHLDTCAGNPAPSKKQASFGYNYHKKSIYISNHDRSLQPMSRARKPGNANQPPERLPIINYSCLKDGALRKKFRELGIPDWGPRDLLQRRHLEWMNLWNANCDAENRKPKRELLQELDIWERTQGGLSSMASSGPTNTVMRKDFDKDAWSTTHGNDFKKLIANAQKSNDASVRSTIPKVNKQDDVPNEPERIPVPDQSIDGVSEAPAPTGSFEKLGELPVDASVNGFVENMAQASQELGDIQTVNPPSENVSSQCSATR